MPRDRQKKMMLHTEAGIQSLERLLSRREKQIQMANYPRSILPPPLWNIRRVGNVTRENTRVNKTRKRETNEIL